MTAKAGARAPEREWGLLIERIALEDQTALAELYDQTSSVVFGVTLRILRDRSSAEEATLDVYMQIWRQARTYEPSRGTPAAWLFCMARSRALDRLRATARTRAVESAFDGALLETAISGDDPEASSIVAEQCRIVREAMRHLTDDQRQVIEVAYFGGLTHSEIAEALGLPIGTVKTRIRAGMERLRQHLASHMINSEGAGDGE